MIDSFLKFNRLTEYYDVSQETEQERILDVYYLHLKLDNKDDLYITQYGIPFIPHLLPGNYLTDKQWFSSNSIRLSGTGCSYRVKTKTINGHSKDLVIKWNRMGQDIPGAEESDELFNAEFNSPFEEFSLVMELRNSRYESPGMIITQRPLAIYVPSERLELWRIGRKEYKMQSKVENHTEVDLDMFRSYAVLYEWVKGIDAAQAHEEGFLQERDMTTLTLKAEKEIKNKGFIVRDRKPHHIIVRPRPGGDLAMASEGKILYAIIDYELLERTPEREAAVKKIKRLNYLKKQKERFSVIYDNAFPPQLKHMSILGVDYIYGHVESTNGSLWVVGKDPDLFDYFLPERWESTPRTKLSSSHDIYHTLTKDNINLVWKVSQVGIQPDIDPFKEDERKILAYGYNSPFEEVSIAVELTCKGIRTIYPRAVYMFGKTEHISDFILHDSRYLSHQPYRTPDDKLILRKDHKYVIIWGYWNGPDDRLAAQDGDYLEGINALSAYRKGLLNQDEYITLCKRKKERLEAVGIEDLNLRGTHLLLSLDSSGILVKDHEGIPEMRVCNFELLKRIH